MDIEQSHILIACATYFIATVSPGPANISIMEIAATKGRKPALIFAVGVLLGSLVWAILAILGVATMLSAHNNLLYFFKILGGIYLFWLSCKSIKKVIFKEQVLSNNDLVNKKLFFQGLALHITNPKAIFTWVVIVTLALPSDNISYAMSLNIVFACMALGILVFGGYAIIFSTTKAQVAYRKFSKWLNGIAAVMFGTAGYKLLTS